MEDRNLKYENDFKAYLFKGSAKRFYKICVGLGIVHNIEILKGGLSENGESNK